MQFSEATQNTPIQKLELFSRGLKGMNKDLDVFSGQHSHQILTFIEPFWPVLETQIPTPQHLCSILKITHNFPLETVQLFYQSIPRRVAVVLKAKVGPTPS
jgi:hypothetical protein